MFGLPEVKRGLVAAAGGLLRLPKVLPYQMAIQVALTGEPLTAEIVYDIALSYAQRRAQFGRPIARNQLIQSMLVEMLGEVTAMQLYCIRVGRPSSSSHGERRRGVGRGTATE